MNAMRGQRRGAQHAALCACVRNSPAAAGPAPQPRQLTLPGPAAPACSPCVPARRLSDKPVPAPADDPACILCTRAPSDNALALAKFIDYAASVPDVWFVTGSDLVRGAGFSAGLGWAGGGGPGSAGRLLLCKLHAAPPLHAARRPLLPRKPLPAHLGPLCHCPQIHWMQDPVSASQFAAWWDCRTPGVKANLAGVNLPAADLMGANTSLTGASPAPAQSPASPAPLPTPASPAPAPSGASAPMPGASPAVSPAPSPAALPSPAAGGGQAAPPAADLSSVSAAGARVQTTTAALAGAALALGLLLLAL